MSTKNTKMYFFNAMIFTEGYSSIQKPLTKHLHVIFNIFDDDPQ